MLSMNRYAQDYVDACRASVARQVSAYSELLGAAQADPADGAKLDHAIAAFEPLFFNNMVLVLDACFLHRSRTIEGKDGNPLNEVRVLCTSLLSGGGMLTADKAIRLKPEASVLKHAVGDPIALSAADFVLLAEALFAEIERKYA